MPAAPHPYFAMLMSSSRRILSALLPSFLIMASACGPAQQVTPTATLQGAFVPTRMPRSATPTITPSPTATPTLTPSPTETPTRTPSPTATLTPEPTATPTQTQTFTPSPDLTGTAIAATVASETQQAYIAATSTSIFATAEAQLSAQQTAIAASQLLTQTFNLTTQPMPVSTHVGFNQISITETVILDTPISGAIARSQFMQVYAFEGVIGEQIDIEVLTSSGSLSPSIFVVDPKGREIARYENRRVLTSDAAIRGLELIESGTYLIAVTRLNGLFGFTDGAFTLTVRSSVPDQPREGIFSERVNYGQDIIGTLALTDDGHVYTFRGSMGDRLSITMTRASGDLDSYLALTDSLGHVLAWNDDDMRSGTTDSSITEYVLPADGYYSLVATRYFGFDNSGNFRMKITQLPSLSQPTIYAPLDPMSSATIRADGQFFSNFSAGDNVATAGNGSTQELQTQTLVTFQIPSVSVDQIERVELRLTPCLESRGGFPVLGELTVYADQYGSLINRRDFTRIPTGARIISEQASCAEVDVTEVVRDLITNGQSFAQYRLIFRQSPLNGQSDEVRFTPNLVFELSE